MNTFNIHNLKWIALCRPIYSIEYKKRRGKNSKERVRVSQKETEREKVEVAFSIQYSVIVVISGGGDLR